MERDELGGTTVSALIETLLAFPGSYKVVFNVLSEGIYCDIGHVEADFPRKTVYILQDY